MGEGYNLSLPLPKKVLWVLWQGCKTSGLQAGSRPWSHFIQPAGTLEGPKFWGRKQAREDPPQHSRVWSTIIWIQLKSGSIYQSSIFLWLIQNYVSPPEKVGFKICESSPECSRDLMALICMRYFTYLNVEFYMNSCIHTLEYFRRCCVVSHWKIQQGCYLFNSNSTKIFLKKIVLWDEALFTYLKINIEK